MTHNLNPTIFTLGPLQVRWYGLMYVLAFLLAGQIQKKLSREGFFTLPEEKSDSLLSHAIIGMFLGARLTYALVYNWDYYSQNIFDIIKVWEGGLSYHGAVLGMILAGIRFSRVNKIHPLQTLDVMAISGSIGVFLGRMGNFINGELYGRVTDSWLGIIFPAGGPYPRHPSQLYEGVSEGIVLFCLLWFLRKKVKHYGIITGIYISGYAVTRFCVEFFREADAQLGYYFGGHLTMGQILCLLMFLCGLGIIGFAKKTQSPIPSVYSS